MSAEHGILEGETCNRNGCTGIIKDAREGQCSCHINPPCGYCTSDKQYCDVCGWENDDIYASKEAMPIAAPQKHVKEREADGKKYMVIRYFDTYPELVIANNLDYNQAVKILEKYNGDSNNLISFDIKEKFDIWSVYKKPEYFVPY